MQVGGSGPPGSVGATWQYTLPHVTVNSSKMGQCWHDATYWESEPLKGLAADGELTVFKHKGFWQPMDTLRDKNQLEELWDADKAPWRIW